MDVNFNTLQHLTNDVILKLFWFMLLYWASTFLKDFLTQVYRGWRVRQSESFKEGDLITVDGTHGRVLSIGYTVVKIQIDPTKTLLSLSRISLSTISLKSQSESTSIPSRPLPLPLPLPLKLSANLADL